MPQRSVRVVIQNFRVENLISEYRGFKERMRLPESELAVRKSAVLPTGPELGLQLNEDYLNKGPTDARG